MKIPKPEKTLLNKTRKYLGILTAIIFILSFIPAPIMVKDQGNKNKPPATDKEYKKYNIDYRPK